MKSIQQLFTVVVLAITAVQASPAHKPEPAAFLKVRTVDGVECFAKRADGIFERSVDLYGCGGGKMLKARGDDAVECFAKRENGVYERSVDLYGCGGGKA